MNDSSDETIDTDSLNKSSVERLNNSCQKLNEELNGYLGNKQDEEVNSLNRESYEDFEHDSLERLQSLNIDKDSLDENVDRDSLESQSDSLNDPSEPDEQSNKINSREGGNKHKDHIDTCRNKASATSSVTNDENSGEIHAPEAVNIWRDAHCNDTRGSRAALDIPCDDAYAFDKFDRFFSAFDFFQEPPPITVKKDKTKTRKQDFSQKKIPLLSYTIARNEKKKCSYLEMYKKKCSRKLKKVMKDTELKSEYEANGSPASDQCSVSSKQSVNSIINEENHGKGDGVDQSYEDHQYYYDAIQKYEQNSRHSDVGYTTSGNIVNNPSCHSNSNRTSKEILSNHSNRNNISNVSYASCHSNQNMFSYVNNASGDNMNKLNVNNPDNGSNTRMKVSDIVKNINKVNKEESKSNMPQTKSSKEVTMIYKKDTKDLGKNQLQNSNSLRQKAHSVQNVTRAPVYNISSQKPMPRHGTQVQTQVTPASPITNDTKNPTNTKRSISSAPVQKVNTGNRYPISTYPKSIQSIAKVYPLSKVYPCKAETSKSNISQVSIPSILDQNSAMSIQANQNSIQLQDKVSSRVIINTHNASRREIQKSSTNLSRESINNKQDTKTPANSVLVRNNDEYPLEKGTLKKSAMTCFQAEINEIERKNLQDLCKGDQKSRQKIPYTNRQEIMKSQRNCQFEIPKPPQKVQAENQREMQITQQKNREISKEPKIISQKDVLKQQKSQQSVSKQLKMSKSNIKKTDNKSQQEQSQSSKNSLTELSNHIQKSEHKVESTGREGLAQSITSDAVEAETSMEANEAQSEGLAEVRHAFAGKATQSEEIFRGSNIETREPKRPATTTDNTRYPSCSQYRYLSGPNSLYSRHLSKPKKSYVEIYQQKRISRRIPVPVTKSNLNYKKVEEKGAQKEKKEDKKEKFGGVNKERKGKTPLKKDDSSKAGVSAREVFVENAGKCFCTKGEGTKVGVIKPTLRRYNLKKKVPEDAKTGGEFTDLSLEDEQDDIQLKMLEEKKEQLQKQLNTMKSKSHHC